MTEETTGIDIVKLQLDVASGERLEGEAPGWHGHAVEARLNAEDPDRGFAPAPGLVRLLELPSGPGIRVDTGVSAGDTIPAEYDSMIAKVIAHGNDRSEALARLGRALGETVVIVQGGTTNKSFLLELLDREELVAGAITTGWLDEVMATDGFGRRPHADVALIAAAVAVSDEEDVYEQAAFFATAARGRPQARQHLGHRVELRYDGQQYTVDLWRYGPQLYRVDEGGVSVLAHVEPLRPQQSRMQVRDRSYHVVTSMQGVDVLVEVDGTTHRISRDEIGVARAPAPGLVVAVPVALDDVVEAGATVAVIEAMKTETPIPSPVTGRVREVLVARNVQVEAGAPLVRIEPLDIESTAGSGGRVELQPEPEPAQRADGADEALRLLATLRWVLLGFDYDRSATNKVLEQYVAARRRVVGDETVLAAELKLLGLFADLSELSRNRRADEEVTDETARGEREYLLTYLRSLDVEREGLPASFAAKLRTALAHYGIADLAHTDALRGALFRLYLAHHRAPDHVPIVNAVLTQVGRTIDSRRAHPEHLRTVLDRLVVATQLRFPSIGEQARDLRYRAFDLPLLEDRRRAAYARVREMVDQLDADPSRRDRAALMAELVTCPFPLLELVVERAATPRTRPDPMLEAIIRRYYVIRDLRDVEAKVVQDQQVVTATYGPAERPLRLVALLTRWSALDEGVKVLADILGAGDAGQEAVAELYVLVDESIDDESVVTARIVGHVDRYAFDGLQRLVVAVVDPGAAEPRLLAYRREGDALRDDPVARGLHPMIAERLQLWRLANFEVRRLPSAPEVVLLDCVARDNPSDQRLIVLAEVRDLTTVRNGGGRVTALPELEHILSVSVHELRSALAARPPGERLEWNRIVLYAWPAVDAPLDQLATVVRNLAPITEDVGLEQVMVQVRLPQANGQLREVVVRVSKQPAAGVRLEVTDPPTEPLTQHDDYARKVLLSRRRGFVYPYEIARMLVQLPGQEAGRFTELELDGEGKLQPVERPPGQNTAAVIVGLASTPTTKYPEGMTRVVIMGDPLKALGSLAEPECRRIIAALDRADELGVPVEWFAVSSGAKISMDSGTENMDWIARALRRIVEFTQAGGEINVVVAGINVGAQPYWNAEATMLMHTKGILVMTPDSAMVLTGKQALDYSGGVSAEDNFGIGGYDRIMGANGQAQYWAADLAGACRVLFAHYDHSYVAPGELSPRQAATSDPATRDVRRYPHASDSGLDTVGDILSDEANPGRKKPFDIRTVLRAVSDQDHPLLERWPDMRDADTAVVVDGHLGGYPVTMIGIESKPLPRWGLLNADGPDQWSAGTLFPMSSKKVARALNAATGNRPVVLLANLSGFDGSPESLRRVQLEYGAEIGRAVVNFSGPIVFCVISRYHGGAFVVFSGALNDEMQILAVEGSYASVIGGAPAAAVVFAGDVTARTRADPRVRAVQARLESAVGAERAELQNELGEVMQAVRSEMLGVVAAEFDAVHSIERAKAVGSVHEIIPASRLRPELIDAVARGLERRRGGPGNGSSPA